VLIKHCSRARLERRQAVIAYSDRRMEQQSLVDQIGCDEGRGKCRASLDHQARDAARCQKFQHRRQIEPAIFFGRSDHFGTVPPQCRFRCGRRMVGGDHPQRRIAGRLY